jgi:DNA-binding MarR family transcriptional regulator
MIDLARAVLLSKSGLTRLVDNIEEAGLVRRAVIPGDRRSLHVQLTPAGRRLIKRAIPVVRGSVEEQFGRHLTDTELAVVRDSLNRFVDLGRPGRALAAEDARRAPADLAARGTHNSRARP